MTARMAMVGVVNGDPFRIVQAGYDRLGARYRLRLGDDSVRLRQLQVVRDRVAAGSTVVELGCGPGEPVTRVLTERYDVVAVDASRVQLEMARNAAPDAMFILADMTRFELKPGMVDAVVSFYALGHVPAGRHAALFGSIGRWLRPGGLLMTSAPAGPSDSIDPAWLGVRMFFGGLEEESTRTAIDQAGLTLERLDRIAEDEGDGRTVEFLWITATRPTAM